MKMRNVQINKVQRTKLVVSALGLIILAILLVGGLTGLSNVDAKSKDKSNANDWNKTLKLISVDTPASFVGTNPYPTKALQGQKLLTVTIDLDRDFKDHLRSSEAGEVYISDLAGTIYNTVDTGIAPSEGPGKKPNHQVTFVFSIPANQNVSDLVFHYGTLYTVPLSNMKLGK